MKEDWIEVALGELCHLSQGVQVPKDRQFSENTPDRVRFLRIVDFTQGNEEPRFIERPKEVNIVSKNDISMVRYGTVGFVCTGLEGAIANNIFRIIPNIKIENSFLINFLKSSLFKSKIIPKGATMQALNFGLIKPVSIPIAPLVEQQAIVNKIEELFSSLDSGIADLKKAQDQLKIYRQAVLKKAFEGDYPQKKIIEIADVNTGATPKRGNAKYWESGTIPWVTSTVVNHEYVNEPSELITNTAIKETNCKIIPKGSLLVAMYGEGKTRGKCSELNIDAATNQALASITMSDENKDSKKFLKLFLLKNYEEIRLLSSGGVQPNLNLTIVKNTVVPFPSANEQHQIVQEIESRLSVCDAVEQSITESLDKAQALRQSILKKAFEGKLLSEEEIAKCKADKDYEPASVLLEKMKTEKKKK